MMYILCYREREWCTTVIDRREKGVQNVDWDRVSCKEYVYRERK